MRAAWLALVVAASTSIDATTYDFEALGAIADAADLPTMNANAALLNRTLQAGLAPGDELRFPNKTFHLQGGVAASGLRNITLRVDGACNH